MITEQMLATDVALQGLTDEQKNAILLMSKNDEDVTMGNRFREVYNQLDATIAKETGIARNGDEKTYLYLERAARQLAEKANSVDGLQTKVNELVKEREKLQKALAEGGDEGVKKQLAQATKDFEGVRAKYDQLKAEYDKLQSSHAAELLGIKVDNVLASAQAGLKFKSEFPQAAVDTLLKQALSTIKGMSPEFVDDGKGGSRLVFKEANGGIARNPENHLEPYTAEELIKKELRAMGILDEGRQQQGGGTKPPKFEQSESGIDVSQARSQTEASNIIKEQLMQRGLVNGSKEYQEEFGKAWQENNIKDLPLQ